MRQVRSLNQSPHRKQTRRSRLARWPNKTFGDPDFSVSATATSGLPVSFAASGNCTVTSPSPGTVHITGARLLHHHCFTGGERQLQCGHEMCSNRSRIAKAATNDGGVVVGQSIRLRSERDLYGDSHVGSRHADGNGAVQGQRHNLGAPVALNAGGVAQFTTSALTVGTHTITAEYSGDANFLTSTGTLAGGQVVQTATVAFHQ